MKVLRILLSLLGWSLIIFNGFLYLLLYSIGQDANLENTPQQHPFYWYLLMNAGLVIGMSCLWFVRKLKKKRQSTEKRQPVGN